MAFITKKHLSRRTFLSGAGVTIALPFLESMIPAATPFRQTAAAKTRTRFGAIYFPHGATMDKWTPATEGKFELTPTLQPLADFKDRMLILSGLGNNEARKFEFEIAGDHPRACGAYLTATHPKMT